MADSLAPKLQGSIQARQPVAEPSLIGDLAGVGSRLTMEATRSLYYRGLGGSGRGKAAENTVLQPLSKRLYDLKNSTGDSTRIMNAGRDAISSFIAANPAYEGQAVKLGTDLGFTQATPQITPQDAATASMNKWLQSPEGMTAFTGSIVTKNGQVDNEATWSKFQTKFFQNQAEQAHIAQTSRDLKGVENNQKLYVAKSTEALNNFIPSWTKHSQDVVDGLIKANLSNPNDTSTMADKLAYLEAQKRSAMAEFRSRANSANIDPSQIDAAVKQAVAPYDDAINMLNSTGKDLKTAYDAMTNAANIGVSKELITLFGPTGATAEFRKIFLGQAAINGAASKSLADFLEWGKAQIATGVASGNQSALVNMPADTKSAGGTSVANPKVVDGYRAMEKKTPGSINKVMDASITMIGTTDVTKLNDPTNQQQVYHAVGTIINASEAHDGSLGNAYLSQVFSPQNMRVFTGTIKAGGQVGTETLHALTNFSASQVRKNWANVQSIMANAPTGLSIDGSDGSLKFKFNNAEFNTAAKDPNSIEHKIRIRLAGEGIDSTTASAQDVINVMGNQIYNPFGSNVKDLTESVNNINLISSTSARFGEDAHGVITNGIMSLSGTPSQPNVTGVNLPNEVKNDAPFMASVNELGKKLNVQPAWILSAMNFETGGSFDPGQKNAAGSGATGLIQFMPETAKNLGTTTEALAGMTRIQQMQYVDKYLTQALSKVPNPTFSDVYAAILWPKAVGKPDDYALFSKGDKAYAANQGLDLNEDGVVTKGEAAQSVANRAGHQIAVNTSGTPYPTPPHTATPAPTPDQQVADNQTGLGAFPTVQGTPFRTLPTQNEPTPSDVAPIVSSGNPEAAGASASQQATAQSQATANASITENIDAMDISQSDKELLKRVLSDPKNAQRLLGGGGF